VVYIGQILKASQRNEVPVLAASCLLGRVTGSKLCSWWIRCLPTGLLSAACDCTERGKWI